MASLLPRRGRLPKSICSCPPVAVFGHNLSIRRTTAHGRKRTVWNRADTRTAVGSPVGMFRRLAAAWRDGQRSSSRAPTPDIPRRRHYHDVGQTAGTTGCRVIRQLAASQSLQPLPAASLDGHATVSWLIANARAIPREPSPASAAAAPRRGQLYFGPTSRAPRPTLLDLLVALLRWLGADSLAGRAFSPGR